MNQHDQMREALLLARTCLKSFYPDTFDKKAIQDYSQAMVAIEQALAAEPAPLGKLTAQQLEAENKLLLSMLKRTVFTLDGVIRSEYEGTNLYENYMSVCRDASALIKQLAKEHPNG